MKKTLSVNLGGTVFQIDEDAYILLDNYLNNLRFHFRKEKGGEEIVTDMEMRISELFTENIEGGQMVITIDDVETVIARMGRPEQLDEDGQDSRYSSTENNSSSADQKKSDSSTDDTMTDGHHKSNFNQGNDTDSSCNAYSCNSSEIKKRLFRDVDHRVLGGVLAGIAAYFGWDPTALRLIFILLGFLPAAPSVLIIYLILLFIIPPARTAAEKLQMRGEPVNVENIGKTVTDGFERNKRMDEGKSNRTGLQKFLDVIVSIIGLLVKVVLGILIILCIPVFIGGAIGLFTLILSFLGIVIHIPSFCWHVMPHFPWNSLVNTPMSGSLYLICALLLAGLPLIIILQTVLQHLGYCRPISSRVKLILLILWLIALIVAFILFFNMSTSGCTSYFFL